MIYIPLLLLLLLLFIGLPVAFAMFVAGIIGITFVSDWSTVMGLMATSPYRSVAHYSLTTVPLFILMAEFITQSHIARELFNAIYRWMGHLPGGVAIAAVFTNAGFGAMCGSSTASAAAMSSIIIPEMQKLKYKDSLSGGVIAVSGTLAMLIPPSVPMILYGTVTEQSVGKLLIAGLLPGIITAVMLALTVVIWVKASPSISPSVPSFSWKEKFESLSVIWPTLILLVLVIGSIYTGFATPTESAAVGAMGAFIIGVALKRLHKKEISVAIMATIKSTGMIFMIIVGATMFSFYLTLSQIPQKLVSGIAAMEVNRWIVISAIIVLYIVLGFIMDQIAIILLATPIVFPVIMALGFDPIWFGVITIVLAEIGLATPPVGLNVFITSSVSKIPLETVFRGAGVFLITCFLTLVLFMIFPEIVLWLPNRM